MIAFLKMDHEESAEPRSSLEIEYGFGRHGGNVRHYVPSPEDIERGLIEIRTRGFVDCNGKVHPPWSEAETTARTAGRLRSL